MALARGQISGCRTDLPPGRQAWCLKPAGFSTGRAMMPARHPPARPAGGEPAPAICMDLIESNARERLLLVLLWRLLRHRD